MDIVTYLLSRSYTDGSIKGITGVLKGKNCTIQSITPTAEGNVITFKWTADDGTTRTQSMTVNNGGNGVSITDARISNGHLMIDLSDGTTIDAGNIVASSKITTAITATENIGSVTTGKTYAAGTDMEAILKDILVKYMPPAVSLTTTPATKLYDIVTDSISTILLKSAVTKKSQNVTKVSFLVGDTVLQEITTGVASGGNFQYQYNPATPINTDVVFKSVATDGKQSSTSSVTIKFVGRSYYGVCDANVSDPDSTVIKSGSNTLKDNKNLVYNGITTDWGKVFYAYPKSFGELTSIKDEIFNINYWDSFQKSEVTVDGIAYYCYTLIEPTSADNNSITFK